MCACGCKTRADDHQIINCRICKQVFKHNCVGLTASEMRTIKLKKNIMWTCTRCSGLGEDIDELKTILIELKNEIAELKKISAPSSTLTDKNFEDIIQEVREREKRRNNVILFNVPEPTATDITERVNQDKNALKTVLNAISMNEELVTNIKPIRLGKAGSERPRPIKVRLPDETMVIGVLKNSYRLKSVEGMSSVRISRDNTPKQTAYYKSLKNELNERLANGESNIGIKYRNGMPHIAALN